MCLRVLSVDVCIPCTGQHYKQKNLCYDTMMLSSAIQCCLANPRFADVDEKILNIFVKYLGWMNQVVFDASKKNILGNGLIGALEVFTYMTD